MEMKLRCIKTREKEFWGFDYSQDFTVGKVYIVVTAGQSSRIYNDKKQRRYFGPGELELFEPEEKR